MLAQWLVCTHIVAIDGSIYITIIIIIIIIIIKLIIIIIITIIIVIIISDISDTLGYRLVCHFFVLATF